MLFCLGQLLLLLVDIVFASEDKCKSGIFRMNPDKVVFNIRTFKKYLPGCVLTNVSGDPKCHSTNFNRHIMRCKTELPT